MKQLSEMNTEQLTYLKQKWSAEVIELDREIIRAQTRLSSKLDRQELDQSEIDALTDDLAKAQSLLDHLTSTSAPQEMIDNQQALVTKVQGELDAESKGTNVLTDTEAYLQQASIDERLLEKQYREDKIAEIDGLLV
ncbi:MAG: hypothetical protein RIC80_00325 [Cyclobacteriaceae bacterium]